LVGATVGTAVGVATGTVGTASGVVVATGVAETRVETLAEPFGSLVEFPFDVPSLAGVETGVVLGDGSVPPPSSVGFVVEEAVAAVVDLPGAVAVVEVEIEVPSIDSTALGDRSSPPHPTPTSDTASTSATERTPGRAGRYITL
jgi:hypothetical protein